MQKSLGYTDKGVKNIMFNLNTETKIGILLVLFNNGRFEQWSIINSDILAGSASKLRNSFLEDR